MRKLYATPEQYTDWETETLKLYASRLAYMVMVMCRNSCVDSSFDRHVLNNAYDELSAIKTILDMRIPAYTIKLLLQHLLGILESEFAAYDKLGRESRLARKLLKASQRSDE